jgi:hypothetical protein
MAGGDRAPGRLGAGRRLRSARGLLGPWHRGTHALLVFGWTAVAAVVWEFAEFTSDRLFGTRMQGGDLPDTLKDLLCGLIGGGVVAACAFAFGREEHRG